MTIATLLARTCRGQQRDRRARELFGRPTWWAVTCLQAVGRGQERAPRQNACGVARDTDSFTSRRSGVVAARAFLSLYGTRASRKHQRHRCAPHGDSTGDPDVAVEALADGRAAEWSSACCRGFSVSRLTGSAHTGARAMSQSHGVITWRRPSNAGDCVRCRLSDGGSDQGHGLERRIPPRLRGDRDRCVCRPEWPGDYPRLSRQKTDPTRGCWAWSPFRSFWRHSARAVGSPGGVRRSNRRTSSPLSFIPQVFWNGARHPWRLSGRTL